MGSEATEKGVRLTRGDSPIIVSGGPDEDVIKPIAVDISSSRNEAASTVVNAFSEEAVASTKPASSPEDSMVSRSRSTAALTH